MTDDEKTFLKREVQYWLSAARESLQAIEGALHDDRIRDAYEGAEEAGVRARNAMLVIECLVDNDVRNAV